MLPVAIVLDLPERVCVDRNAARPDRDFGAARRSAGSAISCAGAARRWSARASGACTCCAARPRSTRRRSPRAAAATTSATDTGRSTSSATSTAAAAELEELLADARLRTRRDGRAARRRGIRRAGGPCSSATSSTAARTRRACCGWSWAWSRRATRCACRATTRTSWCARCAAATSRSRTGSPSRWRSSAAETRGVPRRRATSSSTGWSSHYVLDGGELVVAHAGLTEATRAARPGGSASFALYGDTTGETDEFGLPVRLPWANDYRGPGDGPLRTHAGAGAGVGQQHPVPRHRLRLRRQADRAALPGARARLGAGRAGLLRADRARSPRAGRGGRRASRTCWTSPTSPGKRVVRDRATTAGSASARRTRPRRWR